MRQLILERYHYGPGITEAIMWLGEDAICTLEKPWRSGAPGGLSFESCILDGVYSLRPHTRPSGDKVLALTNPKLGVYYRAEDRPHGIGRYLILIHTANWVEEVVGCIAPGLVRTIANNKIMVRSSRAAMKKIMTYVGTQKAQIEIVCVCGTK